MFRIDRCSLISSRPRLVYIPPAVPQQQLQVTVGILFNQLLTGNLLIITFLFFIFTGQTTAYGPLPDIADQVTFYLGIYIAAMIIGETVLSWWIFRKTYKKELTVDLLTAGVSIFTVGLFRAYIFSAFFIQVYNHRLFDIGIIGIPG